MKKFTMLLAASAIAATAIGGTYAIAQTAGETGSEASADKKDRKGGWGKKGKRGGGKLARICSEEGSANHAERMAAVDAAIAGFELSPEQTALYDASKEAQAAAESQKAEICASVEAGEKPDRKTVKEAMKPVKETKRAFFDSLTDEQQDELKELMPKKGGKHGKGHGKDHGKRGERGDR